MFFFFNGTAIKKKNCGFPNSTPNFQYNVFKGAVLEQIKIAKFITLNLFFLYVYTYLSVGVSIGFCDITTNSLPKHTYLNR